MAPKVCLTLQEIMAEGHSAGQLILQLHDKFLMVDDLGDKQKAAIFEKIAVRSILVLTHCLL